MLTTGKAKLDICLSVCLINWDEDEALIFEFRQLGMESPSELRPCAIRRLYWRCKQHWG